MNLLEIRDLWCWYGDIAAVKGVSFEVKEGEIVVLIGANGAGKSSILRAISGILTRKKGEIRFDGMSLHRRTAPEIVQLGIVHIPEGRRIFPRLTVEENLLLAAFLAKSRKKVQEKLASVYQKFPILHERRKQAGGTLSGGEQQMLAIARALMQTPRLLLCDEPSLGLAPRLMDEIFQILRSVHQSGVSILLVEQNAYKSLKLAHKAAILETGQILRFGSPAELMEDPLVRKAYLGEA